MPLNENELYDFLESKYLRYNQNTFIEKDPISIPHGFAKKEDIEIAAFLIATISWGQRVSIIKSGMKLMSMMDNAPHDFILNHSTKDLKPFKTFVYRTFNGQDCIYFIKSLQNIYTNHQGIHQLFSNSISKKDNTIQPGIIAFRKTFFEIKNAVRTEKHFSDPDKNSSSKRLNMFLRWMVRRDKYGVDFGLWNDIDPSRLLCPLDVHSGRVARALGLLDRKLDDWKAVMELTDNLKKFDSKDPVKYDFALFGLGVFEGFGK
jgi:uncharacterized protein (TIGR02757 family)